MTNMLLGSKEIPMKQLLTNAKAAVLSVVALAVVLMGAGASQAQGNGDQVTLPGGVWIGKYQMSGTNIAYCAMSFSSDGQFRFSVHDSEGKRIGQGLTGTYTLNGSILYVSFGGKNFNNTLTVLNVDQIILNDGQQTVTLKRVR
jgi:hypothetical protein